MQIIIDMDGTICSEERQFSRALASIKPGAKESINALYEQGHTIIIYTARTWAEWEMTQHWLQTHEIKFHQLFMGKPVGDLWIDDRAVSHSDWEKTMEIVAQKAKK